MKAAPKDVTRLVDLQDLDTEIDKVKVKVKGLAVHRTITELVERRTQASDDLIAAQTLLDDLTVAADRAEADVVPVRERLVRYQGKVDAGEMDPKALQSAIEEVEHLKQRISDLEDVELEALDAVDHASSKVDELTKISQEIEVDLHQQVNARDEQVAQLFSEATSLEHSRSQVAGEIPSDLVALYEKIRVRSNGIGVAVLEGRRCSGCGLEATISDYNGYKSADPDLVIRCAECDRILAR